MFVQYSTSGRLASKFTFYLNWPLLITNLMFNLKFFEEILCHLRGNCKQDIQDKEDSNLGKLVP